MDASEMPRGFTLRKLSGAESTTLDNLWISLMGCNSVEAWASGYADQCQPYYYVERALEAALNDLYGAVPAGEILAEIHASGERPTHVIHQYFKASGSE